MRRAAALLFCAGLIAGCGKRAGEHTELQRYLRSMNPSVNDSAARVSVDEAAAAYKSGNAVMIDVRPPSDFAQGHVKGALNIPVAEIDQRFREIAPSKQIIAYCT
jgi:3-mercaptopyruvate sulfurtransferase SseA